MIVSGGQTGFEEDDMGFSAGGTNNDEEEGGERVMEMTPNAQYSPRNNNAEYGGPAATTMFQPNNTNIAANGN